MKNKYLKILANKEGRKEKAQYNELLNLYATEATANQLYHYNLGFSAQKLENLSYEIKRKHNISDKEIAVFRSKEVEDQEEILDDQAKNQNQPPKGLENDKNLVENKAVPENPIIAQMTADVKEGIKIRDEYPFLNDPNCPDEFKILVADKITAYKQYAALHAQALEVVTSEEAEDKLYEIAKEAVAQWELNQNIKAELDAYRDTGKVLGIVPQLHNMKIKQEISEMSEADLLKHRGNALKSVNKYKDSNEEKYNEWKFRLELSEKRLAEAFNRTFKK